MCLQTYLWSPHQAFLQNVLRLIRLNIQWWPLLEGWTHLPLITIIGLIKSKEIRTQSLVPQCPQHYTTVFQTQVSSPAVSAAPKLLLRSRVGAPCLFSFALILRCHLLAKGRGGFTGLSPKHPSTVTLPGFFFLIMLYLIIFKIQFS